MACICAECKQEIFNYSSITQRGSLSGIPTLFVAYRHCRNIDVRENLQVHCGNCRTYLGMCVNNQIRVRAVVRFLKRKINEQIQVNEISSTTTTLVLEII